MWEYVGNISLNIANEMNIKSHTLKRLESFNHQNNLKKDAIGTE